MKREITISTIGGPVQVIADAYGDWAAHGDYGDEFWTVTHIPSGLGAPCIAFEESDAIAIARMFNLRGLVYPLTRFVGPEEYASVDAVVLAAEPDIRHITASLIAEALAGGS